MVTHDVLLRPVILTLKSLFPDELTVTGSRHISGGLPLTPLHWLSAPRWDGQALRDVAILAGPEMAQPSALCENGDRHREGRRAWLGRGGRVAQAQGLCCSAVPGPSPAPPACHARGTGCHGSQLTPQLFPGAALSEINHATAQKRPSDVPQFACPRGCYKAICLCKQPAVVPCNFFMGLSLNGWLVWGDL